jgi:hypothetical protein
MQLLRARQNLTNFGFGLALRASAGSAEQSA